MSGSGRRRRGRSCRTRTRRGRHRVRSSIGFCRCRSSAGRSLRRVRSDDTGQIINRTLQISYHWWRGWRQAGTFDMGNRLNSGSSLHRRVGRPMRSGTLGRRGGHAEVAAYPSFRRSGIDGKRGTLLKRRWQAVGHVALGCSPDDSVFGVRPGQVEATALLPQHGEDNPAERLHLS